MKYLIVNGDDFGASRGINRGIVEAHREGILTSASLLVNASASAEAGALACTMPELSLGLHVDIPTKFLHSRAPMCQWLPGLLRQEFQRFEELTGQRPTHLDSHHNVHHHPHALAYFLDLAWQENLPLREYCPVHHFPKFYGQWNGDTHWEQISAQNLARMLTTEIGSGITELSCHPGYVDEEFATSYAAERQAEVQALTDPRLRPVLQEQEIQLTSFHELSTLLETIPF